MSNIILSDSYEYRPSSESAIKTGAHTQPVAPQSKIMLDMTSRFMGLIVVPGQHITKIEVEEEKERETQASAV